jgi:glutathione S-transferase
LARKFGLAGKDELEQAEVEMYADQVTDFKTAYQTMSYESDQTRKAQLAKKFHEATEPAQLAIFENRLAKTGSGFFAPSGLTYADLMLTLVVELVVAADRREQLLARFPLVKKLIETVNAYPAIAARK